ncbi:hypothetical protein PIB30_070579 [Stylosanthes scabra]|uniref:Uncharacterized protein n=1 Tax=Stylosanthes scabra TaxID=79078 RepID=A0ABU6VQC7_9FABA|nr:hypothetical protein [Stylosanthes scabra]
MKRGGAAPPTRHHPVAEQLLPPSLSPLLTLRLIEGIERLGAMENVGGVAIIFGDHLCRWGSPLHPSGFWSLVIVEVNKLGFINKFCETTLCEEESPEEYLKGINAARASIGVHPLIWDEQLKREAQNFLKRFVRHIRKGKEFIHYSPDYGIIGGTNFGGHGNMTAADAVTSDAISWDLSSLSDLTLVDQCSGGALDTDLT